MMKIDCSECSNRKDKEFDGNIKPHIGRLQSEIDRENMIGCLLDDKIKSHTDAERFCPLKKEDG